MQTKYVGGKALIGTSVFTAQANIRQVMHTYVAATSTKSRDKGECKKAPNVYGKGDKGSSQLRRHVRRSNTGGTPAFRV